MGLTGLFLIFFLVVHASVNALIFQQDGGEMFNQFAYFMSHNFFLQIIELGLFAGLILHIIQGLILWRQNMKARPVRYKMNRASANSKWYSRSMGLLGTLLLLFLIMHLYHFWLGTKNAMFFQNDAPHNLFNEMKEVFASLVVVALYLAGLVSLFFHLLHGFQSAFQTFGLNHKKYTPLIKGIGVAYTIIITLLFASMPLAFYLDLVR